MRSLQQVALLYRNKKASVVEAFLIRLKHIEHLEQQSNLR